MVRHTRRKRKSRKNVMRRTRRRRGGAWMDTLKKHAATAVAATQVAASKAAAATQAGVAKGVAGAKVAATAATRARWMTTFSGGLTPLQFRVFKRNMVLLSEMQLDNKVPAFAVTAGSALSTRLDSLRASKSLIQEAQAAAATAATAAAPPATSASAAPAAAPPATS